MLPEDVEVYRALRDALSNLRARWYVFGGQAAILHGATRFTEDIDITVDLGDRPTATLVAALAQAGCVLRIDDADDFVGKTRVLPCIHEASGIPVDVVLAGPGIEELFFEHVSPIEIEGVSIPVASAEDIIVMKILAGRPKDLEDVVGILVARASDLDLPSIRETLGMIELAIGQSDLRPLFEQCLDRVR
jgi:hypothetical protein